MTSDTPSSSTAPAFSCDGGATCPLNQPCFEHAAIPERQQVGAMTATFRAANDACPCKATHLAQHLDALISEETRRRALIEARRRAREVDSRFADHQWAAQWRAANAYVLVEGGAFVDDAGEAI